MAEHGSVQAASNRIAISQPALSAAIQKVEQNYGLKIFLRARPNKLILTPDGKRFIARAKVLVEGAEEFEDKDRARNLESLDSWHFLVIEDIREAMQALQARGSKHTHTHTRMSHFEVLIHSGQNHFNMLLQGKYTHLWISVPRKQHERKYERKHHSGQSKEAPHHARLHSYL